MIQGSLVSITQTTVTNFLTPNVVKTVLQIYCIFIVHSII